MRLREDLPAPLVHLVGREQDSAMVRDLVVQAHGRLVTPTETGGCGKTQLALLVAAGLVDTFADGVWLVDLAPLQARHGTWFRTLSPLRSGADHDGHLRYRLLEPVRQYARELLASSGELDAMRQRHAMFFLAFAESLKRDASVGGARRHLAVEALLYEYRNFQTALQWTLDTGQSDVGLRLAWALQFSWKQRGPFGESLTWITALLSLPGADAPTPARTVALLTAAQAAWQLCDHAAARAFYGEAAPLARQLGDPWILFVVSADQGMEAQQRGDYAAERMHWQEGLVTTRASGDRISEAILLNNLGRLDIYQGNYATGSAKCSEALRMARRLDDVWVASMALAALGWAALAEGQLAEARALSSELLSLPDTEMKAWALGTLGRLAAHKGQSERALCVAGAAEAAMEARSIAPFPVHRALRDAWLVSLRESVGHAAAARCWAEGRALSLNEAVALAAAGPVAEPSTPKPRALSSIRGTLTGRQEEVAVLVAQGLTNRQIAERLVVTERAAAAHIEHILDKLGVSSRAPIAVWASERGLLAARSGCSLRAHPLHTGKMLPPPTAWP